MNIFNTMGKWHASVLPDCLKHPMISIIYLVGAIYGMENIGVDEVMRYLKTQGQQFMVFKGLFYHYFIMFQDPPQSI